jgi:hypothetical protein
MILKEEQLKRKQSEVKMKKKDRVFFFVNRLLIVEV